MVRTKYETKTFCKVCAQYRIQQDYTSERRQGCCEGNAKCSSLQPPCQNLKLDQQFRFILNINNNEKQKHKKRKRAEKKHKRFC